MKLFYTFKRSILFYIAVLLLLLQLHVNTPSIPAAASAQTHGVWTLVCVSPGTCRVSATEGRCYGGLTAPEPSWGPSSRWTQFEQVERRTGRQRCSLMGGGRQGPKALRPGSGSNYTGGAQGGVGAGVRGMTPTGVKEECSVWRRKEEKKPSKPDKASEEQCEDCRRKRRKRRERRSVQQRERTLMDFMTFRIGQLSS